MRFEALEPAESAADRCAKALRRAILDGAIAPGERLPPERKLAEEFGVNRVTVRSALGQLATSRLVSVRQGSGYVVRDFRRVGGPDLIAQIAELAMEDGDLGAVVRDLLAIRRSLALVVLERLKTAKKNDVTAIRRAVEDFAAAVDDGATLEVLAEKDLAVLAAILDGTNSAVLALFLNPVMRVVTDMPDLKAAMYDEPETNVAGWQLFVAWLEADPKPPLDAVFEELERRDEKTVRKVNRR